MNHVYSFNPFEKPRKSNERGFFPPATVEEITAVIASVKSRPYKAVEKFLDAEPKKSIPANLADWLEQEGIKIGDVYVLPPS